MWRFGSQRKVSLVKHKDVELFFVPKIKKWEKLIFASLKRVASRKMKLTDVTIVLTDKKAARNFMKVKDSGAKMRV